MVFGERGKAPRSTKKTTGVSQKPGLEKVRITVYLRKTLIKKIKHAAVDEEKDVSELVEAAILQYLQIKRDPEYTDREN